MSCSCIPYRIVYLHELNALCIIYNRFPRDVSVVLRNTGGYVVFFYLMSILLSILLGEIPLPAIYRLGSPQGHRAGS